MNFSEIRAEEKQVKYPSPLIKMLMEGRYWVKRTQAAKTLGDLQDKAAVDYLIKALKFHTVGYSRVNTNYPGSGCITRYYDAKDTKREAVIALGKIGGEKAVAALNKRALIEGVMVKIEIAKALGKIGDESSITNLVFMSNDSNRKVRKAANAALKKIRKRAGKGVEEKEGGWCFIGMTTEY